MRKLIVLFVLMFGLKNNYAQIKFEHDSLNQILAKASAENKLVFIDCYTTWCGPCKYMAKYVFTNDTVAKYYNEHFINAKIDMEKGEGINLGRKFNVQAFPSWLFLNGKGELIHRGVSGMEAPEMVAMGKVALDSTACFSALEAKYKSGNFDKVFFRKYVNILSDMYLNTKDPLNEYFQKENETTYSNADNWDLIKSFVSDDMNKAFQYLLSHRDEFNQKYTSDSVNKKITEVYENSLMKIVRRRKINVEKYKEVRMNFEKLSMPQQERILLASDVVYYYKTEDYDNYKKVVVPCVEKYHLDNEEFLNGIAYDIYEKCADKELLAKAEMWAKKACDLSQNEPAVMDTYACLLFKNGNKKLAIKIEEEAIEKLKKKNTSDEEMKQYLENIENWKKN